MFTGFKPNTSINKSLLSADPTESHLETLQREVDTYTRKLEQEKRKYFSIQDTFKNVTEEYDKEKNKLNLLKKENSKAHNVMLQAKVKNLEANLDKAISTFDDTVAHNNKLKTQIDMLRREKKNYIEMQISLEEQIQKFEVESKQKIDLIDKKKKRAEELKEEIIQIKSKNENQRETYLKQFDTLEKEYMTDKRDRETIKFEKTIKPESVDTQPLLKHRLKRIIASNKQKLKMIEQYKKHMKMIESAFNDIKQKSGIDSLEQITNTFIKSEEQNYSLYNYMDELSRNIDQLEQQNADLQQKIEMNQQLNLEKQKILSGVSEEEKNKLELQNYVKRKEESVKELNDLVSAVKPILCSTLLELAKSKFNDDPKKKESYELGMPLSDRNIQEYLADLEKYINILMIVKQEAKTKVVNSIKENTTAYSKPIPSVNVEEIKDKNENKEENNKFIEENKFREYAYDYWEKRRNKAKEL